MMMLRVAVAIVALAVVTVAAQASTGGTSFPLKEVARVALPGPSNRFDYTSIDPTTNRLYIAHMNASRC